MAEAREALRIDPNSVRALNSLAMCQWKARALSPDLLEARLNGVSVWRRPEDRQRHTTFLRVAAGLEPPSAADPLR